MTEEKRATERVSILGELAGEMMVLEPMLIKDIGVAGATVETRCPLQLNSLHDLRLVLGGRSVVVKGRVVHSCISDVDQDIVTYRTGLEFVETAERVEHAIADYIAQLKTTRSGAQVSGA